MDDGTGTGAFAEVNTDNDPALRGQPGLNAATITAFTTGQEGTDFVFYLTAFTEAGDSIESEHATITLGDVPGQPPSAPTKVASTSSASRLTIEYPALDASLNGGLPIESYSLEMDDGEGGAFVALTGLAVPSLATTQLITTGVSEGETYRLRYRARNAYGWGAYSATVGILAAQAPGRPPSAPSILSVSDTEIQVQLDLAIANGGAPLTAHVLEINAGGLTDDEYAEVTSYDSAAGLPLHTLEATVDGLDYGTIYKLRYRAENALGAGGYSDVTLVALNAVPEAPLTPVRVESGSTETSIAVSWDDMQPDPVLDGNSITGYRLYAAREQSNIYSLVYDGTGFPQIRSAIVSGLTRGDLYDFKVSASNFNGEGARSALALRTHSCVPPTAVKAPVRVAATSSATVATLRWEGPEATGGCPITGYALFRSDPALSDPATGLEVWVEANSAYDTNIRDKP
jgi:titin